MKINIYAYKLKKNLSDRFFKKFASLITQYKRNLLLKKQLHLENKLSLIGDILTRYALASTFSKQLTEKAKLKRSRKGKPYITGTKQPIYLSISHSYPWTMCAISNTPIGIDIEQERNLKKDVPQRFFSKEEKNLLSEKLPATKKKELFFTLWTLKESFAKVEGIGIFNVLKKTSFKQVANNRFVVIQSGKLLKNYFIYSLKWKKRYYVAICFNSNEMRKLSKNIKICIVQEKQLLSLLQ